MQHAHPVRLLALLGVLLPSAAEAHTRIKPGQTLIPRSDSSGEKTGPCGVTPATTDPLKRTSLHAGQSLKIYWEETIQHVSHFRIAFSPDGTAGFDTPANILMDNIVDNQSGVVTYTDPATYHQFSATVTVPTTLCETCSIQVIQVMLDNPAAPSNYYSCADIRIVSPSTPITTPAPATNAAGTTAAAAGSNAPAAAAAPVAAPVPAAPKNFKVILQPAVSP